MATVESIINSQLQVTNNFIAAANNFIARTSYNVLYSPIGTYPITVPTVTFGSTDITQDAFDKINGFRPVRPAAFGTIDALAPTAPVLNFADIDETLLDLVSAKLQADLNNGGYGIEPNDEAALWQRERDREAQNALAKVDEIGRIYAQGGFSLPTGALFAAMGRALQESSDKISSVNRDIGIKRADMYVNARKFTIEQGATVERVLVELHRAATENMQVMTALYNSQIAKYRVDIEGGMETIRSNVAIYAADISAFSAVIGAVGEAYKLKTIEQQLNLQANVEAIRAKLELARLDIFNFKNIADIKIAGSEFGAKYYGNLVAAAINSTNAIASQSSTV